MLSVASPRPPRLPRRVASRCLAVAVGLLVVGCGGSDGADSPPGGPIFGAPLDAMSCPGADLSALTSRVYVSSLGTDADGCGQDSKSACATIAKGIAACADSGCGVLVRHGLYPTSATLDLRDGVNVHGSCRFDGEPDRRYRTTLQAKPAPGMPAVRAESIVKPTVFSSVVVVGKDETASATASVAMAVKSSSGLTLTGTTIVAGTGGDAAPAASAQTPGGPGGDGGTGVAAIGGAAGSPGASCASNPPADRSGFGGVGGASPLTGGLDTCHPSGGPDAGAKSGDVAGGAAGARGAAGLYCFNKVLIGPDDGGNGGNGSPGACGRPAQASLLTTGSLTSDNSGRVWAPSAGNDGQVGSVGSGGGGGGDGGICTVLPFGDPDAPGLPGGGGGGGGCGGGAGKGGQQGGASLALVVVDSTLTLDAAHNAVVPGPGGRGGDAGKAQAGGPGGRGGGLQTNGKINFAVVFLCGGSGGAGGAGGYGGAGSAGAAGNGGPSMGLAFSGTTPAPSSTDGIYAPMPGAPGQGATGGAAAPVAGACTGADGPAGQPGAGALAFSLDAVTNPQASLLTAGATLASGQSRTSPDGKVQLFMQSDGNFCLYVPTGPAWCLFTNTQGTSASMQTDGNLCVRSPDGEQKCAIPSGPLPPAWSYLQVRNDGHVVITDGTTVYWQAP